MFDEFGAPGVGNFLSFPPIGDKFCALGVGKLGVDVVLCQFGQYFSIGLPVGGDKVGAPLRAGVGL